MAQEALYHELAEVYDAIYSGLDYAGESAALLKIARRYGPRRPRSLLDVGCGTGRHLEQFARGLRIEGVDASSEMLRVARRRLGPTVRLTRADMRTFQLGRRFDVVVCLFSAFGYMRTRRDRERALANFRRHLNPGGVALVVGWILPDRWKADSIHLLTYDQPALKIVRVTRSSSRGRISRLDMHYLIGRPGRPVEHRSEVHLNPLVPPAEMLESFRRAGFRPRLLRRGAYRDRGLYIGVATQRTPGGHPLSGRGARRGVSRGSG